MKRLIPVLCLAVILSGCGKGEESSTESTFFTEGRFLWSENGEALIIIENSGPCTMGTDDEGIFTDFTDGDLIEIEYDGSIAETYPGQIDHVYSARLIKDGEITDIDSSIIDDLRSMGWLEQEE